MSNATTMHSKVLVIKWAMEMGIIPDGTKWYVEKWEKGNMLENGGKRLYWDWEHRMRTNCTARRPDLTLEDEEKKTILLVDAQINRIDKSKEKRRSRNTNNFALN